MRRFIFVSWAALHLALGAWLAVMASDNDRPVDYLSAEFGSTVMPNPAKAGQILNTHWALAPVRRDCPRYIQRFFYDRDTGVLISSGDKFGPEHFLPTDTTELNRSFRLPPILPKHVRYKFKAWFMCNPLQRLFPIEYWSPPLDFDTDG
jgi:hypothetical protein